MSRFLLLCLVFAMPHASADFSIGRFLKKHFKRSSRVTIIPSETIKSGPYQGQEFIATDLVTDGSPIASLFDQAEKFPRVAWYVDLVAKREKKPIYLEEFNKYVNLRPIDYPMYKAEPLFYGRIFYGILKDRYGNEMACVHESWLKAK